MNKYFLGLIIILCVVFVSGCIGEDSDSSSSDTNSDDYNSSYDNLTWVNLTLDEKTINLSPNQTECVISGTTDGENVTINCDSLNVSNVTVNVINGSFSYKVKNIPKTKLNVFENYTAEDAGKKRSFTLNITEGNVTAKSTATGVHDDRQYFTIKRVFSYEDIQKEFKETVKNVSYDEIVKVNPYNFNGVRSKYSGEVLNFKPVEGRAVYGGFDLAVDGNRNQIIHFFYNGDKQLKKGDNITVWGTISGDKVFGPKDIEEWLVYSGSSMTYGGYRGFGVSSGGIGYYNAMGYDPHYEDSYTSLGNYKFQPDAYAWYIQTDN